MSDGRDPRDRELGSRLDTARIPLPDAVDRRLPSIRRRGTRLRAIRWTAIGVVLALFLAAVGASAFALRARKTTPANHSAWATDRDPELGVSLQYPTSWHLQNYGIGNQPSGCGVLVSNVDHHFRHPDLKNGYTSAWDMRGLPSDLVVVDLHCKEEGPAIQIPPTTFPISMSDMQSVRLPRQYQYGEPEPYLLLNVSTGTFGQDRILFVYLGRAASPTDRQIAARIVSSIRLLAGPTPSSARSPSPIPSPTGSPPPCAVNPVTDLPSVVATPDHGPVGTHVHVAGCGFSGSPWQQLNREPVSQPYGISLISSSQVPGCELIATVQQGTAHVSATGVLTADFIIPSTGSCFQGTPDSLSHPLGPGIYTILVVCHACDVGTFEVTTP